ncbi:MAG TPA: c-type cytochrome [Burkholderiales bacterium]
MHFPVRATALVAAWLIVSALPASAQTGGDPQAGKAKAAPCASCHGADGNGGADPTWPKLAGQVPEYLVEQLQAFKSGARKDPLMSGMAAPLAEQDMHDLAAYYATLPIQPGAASNEELALAGQRIYRGGIVETGVPACMSCHGPSGHGIPPRFPRVNSQKAAYAEKQLLAYKAGRRQDNDGIMTRIAARMSDEQIRAVSEYLAGLH